MRSAREHPAGPRIRWFIAARSRIAEDALTVAAGHGARQLVVLGAGLDTLAYRTPLAERLRIFEVDHPATQAWKRQMLTAASIPLPATLRFVAVDFERETLADALRLAGFDPAQRSFFSWLGVVPYLTERSVFSTLAYIAGLPGGAEVVFDYADPWRRIGRLPPGAAAVGETFQSYFETARLCAELTALGFSRVDDLGPATGRGAVLSGGRTLSARPGWPHHACGDGLTAAGSGAAQKSSRAGAAHVGTQLASIGARRDPTMKSPD